MVTTSAGYGVQGELMMSGMYQGIELQLSVGEENFVYRGDGQHGRTGIASDHDGWWMKDARGIYVPNPNAKKDDGWW